MKRLTIILFLIPIILSACGSQATPTATPIPTATAVATPTNVPQIEPGEWAVAFQFEAPSDLWAVGPHRYRIQLHCPEILEDRVTEWIYFDVTEDVELLPTPVYFRMEGLSTGQLDEINLLDVHPQQENIAVVTLIGLTEDNVDLAVQNCAVFFRWDNDFIRVMEPQEPFLP